MESKNSLGWNNLFYVFFLSCIIVSIAIANNSNNSNNSNTFYEGTTDKPINLDPFSKQKNQSEEDIGALVFNGLFKINSNGMPVVDLANKWEITPDGRTYTVEIKENIFWHDGKILTTKDIDHSISYLKNNHAFNKNNSIWKNISVYFNDKKTIIFHLQEPYAPFLSNLTFPIIPNHIPINNYNVSSNDFKMHSIVGTGPFVIQSISDKKAMFVRNGSYYLGVPKIKNFELIFYQTKKQLSNAMNNDELSASIALLPSNFTTTDHEKYKLLKYTMNESLILFMNNLREPFNSVEVRRNIKAIIKSPEFFNKMRENSLIDVVPGNLFHSYKWALQFHNSELIEQSIMKSLNNPKDAYSLVMLNNLNIQNISEQIIKSLKNNKINFDIKIADNSNELISIITNRDYDFLILNIKNSLDPDPYYMWHTSQIIYPGINFSGLNDKFTDSLIEDARKNIDYYERAQAYNEFKQRFNDLSPAIILSHPVYSYIINQSISGPKNDTLFKLSDRFRDIHLWEFFK